MIIFRTYIFLFFFFFFFAFSHLSMTLIPITTCRFLASDAGLLTQLILVQTRRSIDILFDRSGWTVFTLVSPWLLYFAMLLFCGISFVFHGAGQGHEIPLYTYTSFLCLGRHSAIRSLVCLPFCCFAFYLAGESTHLYKGDEGNRALGVLLHTGQGRECRNAL